MKKKCGICEEVKEEFCDQCSTRDHFEWREVAAADGSSRVKEVMVASGLVCTDCCLCSMLTYTMEREARS